MRRGFQPAPEDVQHLVAALTQLLYASLEGFLECSRSGFQLPGTPAENGPYRVLGLDPSAPDELVKVAYRLLAQRCHPDRGGSTQAMARLNQAYDQIARERGWKKK